MKKCFDFSLHDIITKKWFYLYLLKYNLNSNLERVTCKYNNKRSLQVHTCNAFNLQPVKNVTTTRDYILFCTMFLRIMALIGSNEINVVILIHVN